MLVLFKWEFFHIRAAQLLGSVYCTNGFIRVV